MLEKLVVHRGPKMFRIFFVFFNIEKVNGNLVFERDAPTVIVMIAKRGQVLIRLSGKVFSLLSFFLFSVSCAGVWR